MGSPVIGSKVLFEHPGALQLHDAGLRAGLGGEYAEAYGSFAAALEILDTTPKTLDSKVHGARIERDWGFTCAREAIAVASPSLLVEAQAIVSHSAETTDAIMYGAVSLQAQSEEANRSSNKIDRELSAEHGVTLSLLGRIATVQAVMTETDSSVGDQFYESAHDLLRDGSNGYYLVNNAMVAARQERLNGRLPNVAVWLGRAARGVIWIALKDPGNLNAAVLTAGGRVRHLRTYQVAKDSVMTMP